MLHYTDKEALAQLADGCQLGAKAQLTVIADATLALLLATNDKQAKQYKASVIKTIIETGTYAKSNAYELANVSTRIIHHFKDDALAIVNGEKTLKAGRNALLQLLDSFTDSGTIARADKFAPNKRWMLPNLPLMPKDAEAYTQKKQAFEEVAETETLENSETSEKKKSSDKPNAIKHFNEAMALLEKVAIEADSLSKTDYPHLVKNFARWYHTLSENNRMQAPTEMRPLIDILEMGERYLIAESEAQAATSKTA